MKKDDIIPGELYAVDPPVNEVGAYYGRKPWLVKATVLAAGVPIDLIGGRGSRNTGSHCRLEEELRIMAGFYERRATTRTLPVGHEFVMRTADVDGEWQSEYEESIVAERVKRYAMLDSLDALLRGLGLPPAVGLGSGPDVNADRVQIPTAMFEAWLRRIDPREVAGDAIEAFVEAVCRREPWTGLQDLSAADREVAKAAALREIAEGLAVSDAELAPEEEG